MHRNTEGQPPDDATWAALLARVPHRGVYGVVTTGVVCRFGCASPPPLRGNVRVYSGMAAALAAGFRPCKRCKP